MSSSTMIIRFYADFCSSQHCKTVIERISETELLDWYGPDKKVYITAEDDYTHVIIFNGVIPKLKDGIPKSNIVGISCEPYYFLPAGPDFIEYAKNNISKYWLSGNFSSLPDCFIDHRCFLWYISPLKYIPVKKNLISIMVSDKGFAPGHNYRHQLVELFIHHNFPVDVYGRGCKYHVKKVNRKIIHTNTVLKGEFKDYEPYESYRFHIAIENFKTNHYYSEKIMNPLLCNTIPVYWGCTNIEKYFPNNVIVMTGNPQQDMNLIYHVITNPDIYMKKYSCDVNVVKDKINILKNLDEIFG